MKKCRLFYMIFSVLLSILLETIAIYYGKFIFLITIISFSILVSNLQKKKNEIDEIKKIILEFNMNCDVDMYLIKLSEFRKKCFFSKKQSAYFDLYTVSGYLEKGDFKSAEKMLLEIDEHCNSFNLLGRFIYLKTWCELFFFKNLNEKMKLSLLRIREIIDSVSNPQLKIALLQSYQSAEAKYFILVNRDVDKVEAFFREKANRERSILHKINYNYYHALCLLRLNKIDEGINKLNDLSKINKNLYSCNQSILLLSKV